MIKIEYKERKIIEQMCREDYPVNRIAERIGVSPQTIYKELNEEAILNGWKILHLIQQILHRGERNKRNGVKKYE